MNGEVRVGDIAAASGTTAQGFVTYAETAAGPLQFPLVIVNGASDGPVLCLTAGVHATEYAPIDAVMRVVRALDPAEVRGAVLAVPVVNVPMFASRTGFVSPIDGLNLNKVGAGRADGTASERLAHALLFMVIAKAQYHVDLHAGDLGEMLLPFVGYALTGNPELDEMGETLARLYSPSLVSISTGEGIPPFSDGIVFAASRLGVVSLFAESGGNGTLEERDVSVHLAGICAVMQHVGMLDGTPAAPAGQRRAARARTVIRASRAGLLRLRVAIGDEITEGQIVAEVCNVFGETVETVRSEGQGIAGLVWAHKVVNTGDPIVRYWVTQPAS